MAVPVDDVSKLQQYLDGVVNRADHHAEAINEVVYPLIGAIVHFKNPTRPIKAFSRDGSTGNVIWVWIGEAKYVFSYEHKSRSVVLKRDNTQGKVLARFTNQTKTAEILKVFSELES